MQTSASVPLASATDARVPASRAALAGSVAALAAIGASELVAGFLGAPSLVASVGQVVIDLQPAGAKEFVVGLFGQNDKLAFELFIVAVSMAVGALLGVVARRSFWAAAAGFGAFAVIGFLAALGDPTAQSTTAVIVAGVAAASGIMVLSWLMERAGPNASEATGGEGTAGGATASGSMPDWSRRSFLIRTGGIAAASVAAGIGGRRLLEGSRAAPSVGDHTVPPPSEVATIPAGAELTVDGLTPLIVPNEAFYRIDTTLITPDVAIDGWQLRIHGMVDRETSLTYDELVALPMFEQYVTIACVSNEVGGDLVGNAKWTGVRLRDVLDIAGVQSGATQLVGRSVDGFTAGMPTAWVQDPAREPMIAVKMNDELLPRAHGFPARLIVPGLYGYVSATKWLSELELTTMEAFDGFWIPRGWAKEAPVLTQSRIDVPRHRRTVAPGLTAVAGVAWAPDRGVSKVEVAIDQGDWHEANVSTPISDATWVQWSYDWDAAAGDHLVSVRAIDGTGDVQTAAISPPAPDGARGHHTIRVTVR